MNGSTRTSVTTSATETVVKNKPGTIAGAVARIYWMMVGHALLAIFAMSIYKSGGEIGTLTDAAFFANLLGVIAVRYLDIARLGGATADGQEATMSHWRKFSAIHAGVWGLVWLLVHL